MRARPRKTAGDRYGSGRPAQAVNAKRPPWSGIRQRKLQELARSAGAAKKNGQRSARDSEDQRAVNVDRRRDQESGSTSCRN
ncbi:hypothetical protein P9D51_10785 [Bacillus sonorensis]|uniref:hypothetical protein n=1 Tax=Bacillus sonorensis TaxID=119858 RepID=UPI002DBA3529|nr:hypothetical protein [Bacillus sonorensis]MEC1426592.1 hypothetical protein [Bacillus sonorensis]